MATAGSSEMGLHCIPAELLHRILASRDSLRCRDLGRLACTCRLFTTAHATDHVDTAAETIVACWSPIAQARLQRKHRPAGSQYHSTIVQNYITIIIVFKYITIISPLFHCVFTPLPFVRSSLHAGGRLLESAGTTSDIMG